MKQKELRLTIPENLHDRFKVICIQRHLSVPKQVAEIIRKFVEIREIESQLSKE